MISRLSVMVSRIRPQTSMPKATPNIRAAKLGQLSGLAAMATAAHLAIGCSFAAEMLAPGKEQTLTDASLTDVDGKDVLTDTVEDVLDGGKEADALADVALDTIIDVDNDTPDVLPDVLPDVEQDSPLDTLLDVIPDITEDVVQDVAEDIKPDIIPDVIEDIAQDIIPDITEDVIQDVVEAEADVADGPVCAPQNYSETDNWIIGTVDPSGSLDPFSVAGALILNGQTYGSYLVAINVPLPNNLGNGANVVMNILSQNGTNIYVETQNGDCGSNWSAWLPLNGDLIQTDNGFDKQCANVRFVFTSPNVVDTPQLLDFSINTCSY
ncbi:MAG: hypothetical protein KKC80_03860 [Candidatus Margulisbacteria bacterium]|nr:hypothetical protein [Candidatus Margulisiibacteriota bacterium]MBU1617398.1 hypothetical protein [Candidatus Margulisiibacteriota bacterium]